METQNAVVTADRAEIARALPYYMRLGTKTELRVLGHDGKVSNRFFTDPKKLIDAAIKDDAAGARATWVLRNLLAPTAKTVTGTKAVDIAAYAGIVFDFDPVRQVGPGESEEVSATDAEKQLALEASLPLHVFLEERGLPYLFIDSGNGYQTHLAVDFPNADGASTLVRNVLRAAALVFATDEVNVDLTVYDPSRVIKLPGTAARKGTNTVERPHRLSRILKEPTSNRKLDRVEVEALLEALSARIPAGRLELSKEYKSNGKFASSTKIQRTYDALWRFAEHCHLRTTAEKLVEKPTGEFLQMITMYCPRKHDSGGNGPTKAFIAVNEMNQLRFECKGHTCADVKWQQFRAEQQKKYGHFRFPYSEDDPEIVTFKDPETGEETRYMVEEIDEAPGYALSVIEPEPDPNEVIEPWSMTLGRNTYSWDGKQYKTTCRQADGSIKETVTDPEERKPKAKARNTDMGNAVRLVNEYGDQIRYVEGSWYVYNGKVWISDPHNVRVGQLYLDMLKKQRQQLKEGEAGDKQRKWLTGCESSARIEGAIKVAKLLPGIAVSKSIFDSRTHIFNAANGTMRFDPVTGEMTFGEFRADEYATKQSPVKYDPDAKCPKWEKFFSETFPSADVQKFVQAYLGLSLIGIVDEKVMIFHGEGDNGKSTIFKTFAKVLGEPENASSGAAYFQTCDISAFTLSRYAGEARPKPELINLAAARMIVASEVNEGGGTTLNMATIKMWTGGDGVKARLLHANAMNGFQPQATLMLATNHLPKVSDDSKGAWKRLRLVPCPNIVTDDKKDKNLDHKLAAEGSGILNWLLEGVRYYFASGRCPVTPIEVADATEAYRDGDNPVRLYLKDMVRVEAGALVATGALYRDFKTAEGIEMTQRKFTEEAKRILGCPVVKDGREVSFEGIARL